jgi:uncharacterized iron-regulated protein
MRAVLCLAAALILCGAPARATRPPIETRLAEVVGSAPVLVIGENHNDPPSHRLLRDLLPALKALNVSILAVELPSDWQDKAAAFRAGRHGPLAELETRLAARLEEDGQSAESLHSWFALMRAASEAGLALHFVDLDSAAKEAGYVKAEKDPAARAALDEARERSMSKRTAELSRLAYPGKTVLLVGAQHARVAGIPALLRSEGLNWCSIRVMPHEPEQGALELARGSPDGLDFSLSRSLR